MGFFDTLFGGLFPKGHKPRMTMMAVNVNEEEKEDRNEVENTTKENENSEG